MICRPSKDIFSILKRNSHLLLYPCMPYATTQTQTTIYVFSFMIPSAVVALIPPTPAMHFISRSTLFLQPLHSFPGSFVWICRISSGACSTTPLQLAFIFIPRPWAEGAFMELLFSVHLYNLRHLSKVVWHLVHHLCSTQHHCPWHGHHGFCWVCVTMIRPLGSLLPWRESKIVNCKGVFVYFFKLRFPVFLNLISWIVL